MAKWKRGKGPNPTVQPEAGNNETPTSNDAVNAFLVENDLNNTIKVLDGGNLRQLRYGH